MAKEDRYLFDQLVDYLAIRYDFFVNYKEFMEWFFVESVFSILRNASNKYHTGLDRLLGGFKLLGLRLSEYNLSMSTSRFDS